MNGVSMVAAYCLSNQRAVVGRYLGATGASLFILYGVVTNQPAFVVADIIFLYIYISAVLKFNKKRDSYREKAADDEETIAQMRKIIKRANTIELEILETRIGKQTKKKLELRKSLQKQLYILLKIGEKIENDIEDE
ncbi:TMhelix containing protein [Vibrio phage 2.275.O._10N.286.54.E11]|nr:TMhelix containing protein [Vibrio phage 2.275.O._10N.286.54.E11]